MAATLQSLQGTGIENIPRTKEGVYLFGVRHLSAAGAWHLKKYLEKINPDLVLIEGPSDATDMISDISKKNVKPPIAILCYTTEAPVHSIVYPYAVYSPEYQAILWADKNKKTCRFVDLPSGIKSPLYRLQEQEKIYLKTKEQEINSQNPGDLETNENRTNTENEDIEALEKIKARIDYYDFNRRLYDEIAALGNEENYDVYWERYFEHNLEEDSYLKSVALHSAKMRSLTEEWEMQADTLSYSINTLREAHIKRCIKKALDEGTNPEKIVVVTGAYHVQGLINNDPMTDEEFKQLKNVETKMTLMPYSYYKLSSFSGYGAGNHAPYYYELMYRLMEKNNLESLPPLYLSNLSDLLRKKHGYSSTATVIEAVRLAKSLQYMHDGILPTLKDLHDASVATMANGYKERVIESFAMLDVGTRIGSLPEGVSQTPIQDDMNRNLKKLKLEKYKTVVAQDLSLDLRENRKVKSEEAAFIDLNRSTFFHRLKLLSINFAKFIRLNQNSASWAEQWVLCWTPEVEIQIVESVLYGNTIETAAAYILKEKLETSQNAAEVAKLVKTTCECKLFDSIHYAIKKLQALASESENFVEVATAAREISFLIQYGSLRKFDTEYVIPILKQLFLKGSLLLVQSSSCNDEAAKNIADNIAVMHNISQEHYDIINDEIWLNELKVLAKSDYKNPLLCGFAFSLLLERSQVSEEQLSIEVSRHLSLGNTPEAGASWFEGLSRRNRYVLLSRVMLWQQLDLYLNELEDDEFKKALVCLRRAFSNFEPHEKNGICDILSELWGLDPLSVHEMLQDELNEQEEQILDDLNDFDFGDLL